MLTCVRRALQAMSRSCATSRGGPSTRSLRTNIRRSSAWRVLWAYVCPLLALLKSSLMLSSTAQDAVRARPEGNAPYRGERSGHIRGGDLVHQVRASCLARRIPSHMHMDVNALRRERRLALRAFGPGLTATHGTRPTLATAFVKREHGLTRHAFCRRTPPQAAQAS